MKAYLFWLFLIFCTWAACAFGQSSGVGSSSTTGTTNPDQKSILIRPKPYSSYSDNVVAYLGDTEDFDSSNTFTPGISDYSQENSSTVAPSTTVVNVQPTEVVETYPWIGIGGLFGVGPAYYGGYWGPGYWGGGWYGGHGWYNHGAWNGHTWNGNRGNWNGHGGWNGGHGGMRHNAAGHMGGHGGHSGGHGGGHGGGGHR